MSHNRHAIKIIISNPPMWMAMLTIIVIEFVFYNWFQPPFVMMIATICIGFILLLIWPMLFTRSESFYRLYYRIPTESTIDELKKLDHLESTLTKLGSIQGAKQIQKLQEKIGSLNEILEIRFNSGELTFGRYFNTARRVYLSAMNNLREVEIALRSVTTIDVAYINNRIHELRSNSTLSNEQLIEIETLKQRQSLHGNQLNKVEELLTQNEAAITALVKATTALADIKGSTGYSSVNAEAAMEELEILANRAEVYSEEVR